MSFIMPKLLKKNFTVDHDILDCITLGQTGPKEENID